jgi:hypothetical protein
MWHPIPPWYWFPYHTAYGGRGLAIVAAIGIVAGLVYFVV